MMPLDERFLQRFAPLHASTVIKYFWPGTKVSFQIISENRKEISLLFMLI